MNTNEFRHPKERLQNLSSRHKVSTISFLLCDCGCVLWWEDVGRDGSLARTDLQSKELFPSMCVLPVMCRLAEVQLTMQEWCPLGTNEALYGIYLGHGGHLSFVCHLYYHNFAKASRFVQVLVSPVVFFLNVFLFFIFMKVDKKHKE